MSKNNTVVDMRKFVEARNGEVFTSTRQVAEAFEKLHNHVIAKVRALECSAQFLTDNFSSVQFEHRGNTYEAFEMTKDGFMFLVMSFTPVPMGAFVLTRRQFMQSMLVHGDMPVSTAEMFEFVALATENLRRRSLYQAARRAVA
ncbi:Rha family transcriptional regulator [Pseudomonas sp. S3E12]|uniref:Rha family transcriptional regulator n=1 Tax=Pseudomonas sp. S3E12 TaxID=1873126 RepID=UPI00081BE4A9|nr:Rha family transcriptional regulator [Pseudomonas sp. S3E12]OCW22747.1 hypothetical protein BB029_18835 [Pseudomonas sp. S3E12]